MAKDDKSGAGGANDGVSDDIDKETDDGVADPGGDDETEKVSRSTYKKAVSQAKSARERAKLAEERASQLEQEKLAAEGNKDEQLKKLNADLLKARQANKEIYGNIAKKTLNAQVKAAATAAGCIDPDAVLALADLSELDVDSQSFEADAQDVQAVIAALKKSKAYLFNKSAPNVNTRMPGGQGNSKAPQKEDLSKLTTEQLRNRLRQLDVEQ